MVTLLVGIAIFGHGLTVTPSADFNAFNVDHGERQASRTRVKEDVCCFNYNAEVAG